jgi:hypothetical protein
MEQRHLECNNLVLINYEGFVPLIWIFFKLKVLLLQKAFSAS